MVRLSLIYLICLGLFSCLPETPERGPFDPTGPNYQPLKITQLEGPGPFEVLNDDIVIYRFGKPNQYADMSYKYKDIIRPVQEDGIITFENPEIGLNLFGVYLAYPYGNTILKYYRFIKLPVFSHLTLYLRPDADSVGVDVPFNLEFIVAEMPAISDIEFALRYNPDSLRYSRSVIYDDESVGGYFSREENEAYYAVEKDENIGLINYKCGLKDNDGTMNVSGSGRLLRTRFYSNSLTGNTKVTIQPGFIIRDSFGNTHSAGTKNATIHIY